MCRGLDEISVKLMTGFYDDDPMSAQEKRPAGIITINVDERLDEIVVWNNHFPGKQANIMSFNMTNFDDLDHTSLGEEPFERVVRALNQREWREGLVKIYETNNSTIAIAIARLLLFRQMRPRCAENHKQITQALNKKLAACGRKNGFDVFVMSTPFNGDPPWKDTQHILTGHNSDGWVDIADLKT